MASADDGWGVATRIRCTSRGREQPTSALSLLLQYRASPPIFLYTSHVTMNSKSLRRLATDHGSLHTAGLPPNYLFPPSSDGSADLTSLDILLAGPVGTPYAGGVWRLHLDIPSTYPIAPPTAQFRTRLWHPNIDEATGAVCVETLKRDWSSTLKLRDVLVTISCLLIQPNPASALNEAAGKLATEDWQGYCRRAKLMTEIHAAIPKNIASEVKEAQMRGEDSVPEPKPEPSVPKIQTRGKDKERVKVTPTASKVQRLASEDEENTRQRGETQEPESDPESDWIPGPDKPAPPAARRDNNNIFGIKGLEETIQLDTPPKRMFAPHVVAPPPDEENDHDNSDPFITVATKRANPSFDLRLPPASTLASSSLAQPPSTDTPELLKFSHQNPFSAIQPNNQTHILIKEFSYSWEESEIVHETGTFKDGASRVETRKRIAGEEFEKKKDWEMKRFKKAGYHVGRYNRGDWGPRMGIGRL
ncbi:UBC-like protein [Cucurbitaria berberidis CBS 394.84]|uniref:UBC-like protein n=1 Tax=Cucurbitaria berberidis CBS 394.84 TaxID=1168544 RepID=A0A9P4G8J9_9PLEO|nr:UBC-like protein [Cucurbitaria berberidis CBS 394.84]KAF1840700.1 UBC-like protein [Cucurbitaria berberidis CBS 394.84]